MTFYLETSAAAKLIFQEVHSGELREWLRGRESEIASSDLLRTELLRVTRRADPEAVPAARQLLDNVVLTSMPTDTFERAAHLDPSTLRSLDALHLAAALELGDALDGIVTYDDRLAQAARDRGVQVVAPGVTT